MMGTEHVPRPQAGPAAWITLPREWWQIALFREHTVGMYVSSKSDPCFILFYP